MRAPAEIRVSDVKRKNSLYSFFSLDTFRLKVHSFDRTNGRDICVPQDFVCDGAKDCSGGEDEALCRMLKLFSNDRCVSYFQF